MNRDAIDREIIRIMIEDGPDGHCDGHEKITDYVMTLIDPLVALLRETLKAHDTAALCMPPLTGPCHCGADEWNARIDAALAGIEPNRALQLLNDLRCGSCWCGRDDPTRAGDHSPVCLAVQAFMKGR